MINYVGIVSYGGYFVPDTVLQEREIRLALSRKKQYRPIDIYEEEQPSWISTHLPVVFAGIAVILIAVTAVIITMLVSKNTPVKQLMRAFSSSLDSSCSFHIDAQIDQKPVMTFDGAVKTDSRTREVQVSYDAVYPEYTYQGVILTQNGLSYKGNCLSGQWTVSDDTQNVLDFFDFYTDFQNGDFDTSSFLRYFGLTDQYSAIEFQKLINELLPRFSSSNSLSHLTIENNSDGSTTYSYAPDIKELIAVLSDSSAPVFSKSSDYEKFKKTVELNQKTIDSAVASMVFDIDQNRRMTSLKLQIKTEQTEYTFDITFSGFSNTNVAIPAGFYEAAHLENPATPDEQ